MKRKYRFAGVHSERISVSCPGTELPCVSWEAMIAGAELQKAEAGSVSGSESRREKAATAWEVLRGTRVSGVRW
jgi:hypothetical protein